MIKLKLFSHFDPHPHPHPHSLSQMRLHTGGPEADVRQHGVADECGGGADHAEQLAVRGARGDRDADGRGQGHPQEGRGGGGGGRRALLLAHARLPRAECGERQEARRLPQELPLRERVRAGGGGRGGRGRGRFGVRAEEQTDQGQVVQLMLMRPSKLVTFRLVFEFSNKKFRNSEIQKIINSMNCANKAYL